MVAGPKQAALGYPVTFFLDSRLAGILWIFQLRCEIVVDLSNSVATCPCKPGGQIPETRPSNRPVSKIGQLSHNRFLWESNETPGLTLPSRTQPVVPGFFKGDHFIRDCWISSQVSGCHCGHIPARFNAVDRITPAGK